MSSSSEPKEPGIARSHSEHLPSHGHGLSSVSQITEVSSPSKNELLKTLSFSKPKAKRNSTYFTPSTHKVADMKPNLHRTFREIPYDIRERVVDLVTRAENNAEEAKLSQLQMNKELLNLRRDYYQTDKEVSVQIKKRDFYLNQINLYNEKLGALEDDAEGRRVRALKNAEAIHRLSRTNKNLVDAFSKLYDDDKVAEVSDDDGAEKSPVSSQKRVLQKKLSMRRGNIAIQIDDPLSPPKESHQEPVAATSNEKLRERLLDVAKEHNRVVKNVEILEIKVEGLRSSVRFADRRNRQLKAELDELRESASLDGSSTVDLLEAKNVGKDETTAAAAKKPKTQRAAYTSRLNALLANPEFDALDGIRHLDALLQHVVATPTTLSEKEVASHLCNRFVCHIFKARAISIFLVQPGGQVMHRYTTDSNEVKVIPLVPPRGSPAKISCVYAPSIAEWVIRHKEHCCLSHPEKHKKFRAEVDRPTGMASMKRLLSVPLWDLHNGAVVGAVHILNKIGQNKRFSAADESFASAYGELVGALVSSSVKYNRLATQSQSMCSLIQAPLQLLDSFHDVELMSLADALCALEETLKDTLHCAYAKAFLFAPSEDNKDNLGLYTLDMPPLSLKGAIRHGSAFKIKRCALSAEDDPDFEPSIVAYTVKTQRPYLAGTIVSPDHPDYAVLRPEGAEYNSSVDMAPSPASLKKSKSTVIIDFSPSGKDGSGPVFYCVPILNLQQEVIGCLQACPSSKSPPLKSALDINTTEQIHTITFQDAMGWMGYLLSSKVAYISGKIEQPMDRHGFFMEPLSVTKDLNSMEISLAPPEEDKYTPRCVTTMDVENQIAVWDRSYESLNRKNGGGGVSASNPGSNNNTGRNTPEKDITLKQPSTDEHAALQSAEKPPLHPKEEVATPPVKPKRKELKEYVTQMRDMHRIIEQLRVEARNNENSAGARLEEKVRAKMTREHEAKIQAEANIYLQQLEDGSAKARKLAEEKKAEIVRLKGRLKEFDDAVEQRARARAEGEEKRRLKVEQAEESMRLRKANEEESARRKAAEIQRLQDEEDCKQRADEEAAERKALKEAKQRDMEQENEAARQRAEDAAIIREAEEEAARKSKEEEKLKEEEDKALAQKQLSYNTQELKQEHDSNTDEKVAGSASESLKNTEDINEESPEGVKVEQHDDASQCWEECLDENGAVYFYNTLTEESVWDAPENYKPLSVGQEASVGAVGGWLRMEDNSGEVYWVNEETGETEWGDVRPQN